MILERRLSEPLDDIITIDLFGEQFRFKADTGKFDPHEVAEFLKEEIVKAAEKFPGKSYEVNKYAVLLSASLNITAEYFDLKKTYSSLCKGISERSESLISEIDKNLK